MLGSEPALWRSPRLYDLVPEIRKLSKWPGLVEVLYGPVPEFKNLLLVPKTESCCSCV